MARGRVLRVGRKSARLTQWIAPADQGYISVATGGATLFANFPAEEPFTVMRSRGQVSIQMSSAADLNVIGAFGMAVVSQEAFAAGVASVPEPFSDADWGGWFVWRSFSYRVEVGDATGFNVFSKDFEVDSKAMRKLSPNEVIILVAESQAGAFSISAPIRVLLKLS